MRVPSERADDAYALVGVCGAPHDSKTHIRAALFVCATLLSLMVLLLSLAARAETHVVKHDLTRPPDGPRQIEVTVTRDGGTLIQGEPCLDLIDLRQAMDITQQLFPVPAIILEVHPEARYDQFVDVFTVMKRANVKNIEILETNSDLPLAPVSSLVPRAVLHRAETRYYPSPPIDNRYFKDGCGRAVIEPRETLKTPPPPA